MPQELLTFTPAYCLVGVYRLITDEKLWRPIWKKSSKAIKRGAIVAAVWTVIAGWPLTRLYVQFFMNRSWFPRLGGGEKSEWADEARFFGINVRTYATFMFVLSQCSFILEYMLSRQLKQAREHVYESTVASRGKTADFWGPYEEEWLEPPTQRAIRSADRLSFYTKLAGPLVRLVVTKVLLLPLNFIPLLGVLISSALRSLTMARVLHKPYFVAKKMTPLQIELFIVERQYEYRSFGFCAAFLERLPLIGLLFSVSNRIGAAQWAHDLEKRQHLFRAGKLQRTQRYVSKTERLPPNDLPDEFSGGFPRKKGPANLAAEGAWHGDVREEVRRAAGGGEGLKDVIQGKESLRQSGGTVEVPGTEGEVMLGNEQGSGRQDIRKRG